MAFTFEVRETDLLGRIGTIVANGRKMETPCLLPVIHPVNQAVGLGDLKAMGFKGLMTNSYILYRRRKEESLRHGIHQLLGFEGMLMTDSGGYQVLQYGEVDVSYSEIADFQSRMGSDLAVTLDRPTGYSASRKFAKDTAEYSTHNALATLKEYGMSDTTWMGPVQGGLFSDILRKSTRSLIVGGFRFLALGSPVQVMENYRYTELVRMIVATRRAMPYSTPLHLFGAGHPHVMAIAVALGCDTFDSASYVLFAREGRYMTEQGASTLREMNYLPCSCPVCVGTSVRELLGMDERERTKRLATHNLYLLRKEVEACKEAIAEGRLWDLVEERAAAHPSLHEAFLELTGQAKPLEPGTAALKDKGLLIRGGPDERRPELAMAASRLGDVFRRSSAIALLLTTNHSLPVSKLRFKKETSQRHAYDLYRLHPQLGLYPAELDFVYPFTQTVATTPEPSRQEVADASRKLRRLGYTRILLATVDGAGGVTLSRTRSRPRSAAASPSPRSASSRPRAPRRP